MYVVKVIGRYGCYISYQQEEIAPLALACFARSFTVGSIHLNLYIILVFLRLLICSLRANLFIYVGCHQQDQRLHINDLISLTDTIYNNEFRVCYTYTLLLLIRQKL